MSDTITETYTLYEQACSQCIDDLYRTACLVLVDADAAEKLVTDICVAGVQNYNTLEDGAVASEDFRGKENFLKKV
ncbi:MAG: hypothetical protein E7658_09180 [Ruminococcaceae bacterium]|nr:hypothetical protein [Oscillospiraceae bacterium]